MEGEKESIVANPSCCSKNCSIFWLLHLYNNPNVNKSIQFSISIIYYMRER